MKCPHCGLSSRVIKAGIRHNKSGSKQMYYCNGCRKKFTLKNQFYKKRFSRQIINFALNKRRDGEKVRVIHLDIQRYFNVQVSIQTLYNWFSRKESDVIRMKEEGRSPPWTEHDER